MADEPSEGAEHVRPAEVIGALCPATDLGMGFRSSMTGGPRAAARETYLVSLLGVWS